MDLVDIPLREWIRKCVMEDSEPESMFIIDDLDGITEPPEGWVEIVLESVSWPEVQQRRDYLGTAGGFLLQNAPPSPKLIKCLPTILYRSKRTDLIIAFARKSRDWEPALRLEMDKIIREVYRKKPFVTKCELFTDSVAWEIIKG